MFGDDILKSVGIILMVIFICFIVMKSLNLQLNLMSRTIEGMDGTIEETKNTASVSSGGVAGNAEGFNESIKSAVTNMKDTLLFSKYRTNYEDIIINYEEYISLIMLQTLLTTNNKDTPEHMMKNIEKIVALDSAKNALNNVMKYVDTQSV